MEKLFEVVSSLIPDEQKEEIKAKLDNATQEVIKEREKEVKIELSKKFGVNFLEPDVNKAFNNERFVLREELKQKEESYLAQLNELKAEKESFEQQFNTIKEDAEKYQKEKVYNEVSVKLLTEGFNPQRLEVVKPFVSGENTDEIVEKIKTSLPELFISNHQQQKLYPENKFKEINNGWSEYIEAQKRKIKT